MKECCDHQHIDPKTLQNSQIKTLKIVLFINLFMFVFEVIAGIRAHSTSLLADSLDMLADSISYFIGLYVVGRGSVWHSKAALTKGIMMALLGVLVLSEAIFKSMAQVVPSVFTMSSIALLAFIANTICVLLLNKHKNDDINMRSTWLCSRNDMIANVGVMLAALMVHYTQSFWPDVALGSLVALLFLYSSFGVIKSSLQELKDPSKPREPHHHHH